MRTRTRQAQIRRLGLLCACVLALAPRSAAAVEISGGVSVGGMLVGISPRLAVSPNAGLSWDIGGSFQLGVHDLFHLLPATDKSGVGLNNQTAITLGYAWKTGDFSVGPSLSIYYYTPACGVVFCGRLFGLSPGGHAQVNAHVTESLGLSVSANVDWVGGISLVFPGAMAAMVVAGPVLRWSEEKRR